MTEYSPQLAAKKIQAKKPGFTPSVGLVLGSGLGDIANQLNDVTAIPYTDIPGFPKDNIKGHPGKLVLGYFREVPIACLQGRVHLYQGLEHQETIKLMIRTLNKLGCQTLIATNAAGSLRKSIDPGDVVLINDHINLHGTNPLVGPNDDRFGPRFLGMDDIYCPELRNKFLGCAQNVNVALHQGVYIATLGPVFETPAEIRAFQIWGADVVGMSTVPEVIVAHHCGMKVAVLSVISNKAAGISDKPLSHELTIEGVQKGAGKLRHLLDEYFKGMSE